MYHFDPYDNCLVLDGVEKGIADAPDKGIANLRNTNTSSIPGEVSVNFKTLAVSHTAISSTGSILSASGNVATRLS